MKLMMLFLFSAFTSIVGATDIPKNYPIPTKTQELMFYIQRNHNSNTIVYEAHFDENGMLDTEEPLLVSWIRYDEQGQRMELRTIEKWYAYGLKSKKVKEKEGVYEIALVAYKDRVLQLVQTAPYKAQITMRVENQDCQLDHIYIQADNSSAWPSVEYIELFGFDWEMGHKKYEKILNK